MSPRISKITGEDNQSAAGTVQFFEYHQPALEAGDYTVEVQQRVVLDGKEYLFPPIPKVQHFSVRGPRFALDPQEILAVFPPHGSLGEHSNVLPHIILKRSTLPWERPVYEEARSIPWLALLLFDSDEQLDGVINKSDFYTEYRKVKSGTDKPEDEVWNGLTSNGCIKQLGNSDQFANLGYDSTVLSKFIEDTDLQKKVMSILNQFTISHPVTPHPATVQELKHPTDPTVYSNPKLSDETGDQDTSSLSVIDVPKILLSEILPTKDELKLLAHVRQTEDARDNPQGDEVAVIICNRLPKPGSTSIVHLVSVEGMYGETGFVFQDDKYKNNLIRLVSLYSWRFACVSERHSFKGLLMHLNHQLLFNLPIKAESDEVVSYLSSINDMTMPDRLNQAFLQSNQPIPGKIAFKDQSTWKITEGNKCYFVSKKTQKIYDQAGRDTNNSITSVSDPQTVRAKAAELLNLKDESKIADDSVHWWLGINQPEYFLSKESAILYVYHLDPDSSSTLRLPDLKSNDENANNLAKPYLAMGCVPLPHEMRQGNKSVSWYHGPLIPGEIPSVTPLFEIDLPVDLSPDKSVNALRPSFSTHSIDLSDQASLSVISEDRTWLLHDGDDHYRIIKDVAAGKLNAFKELLPIRSADDLIRYNKTTGMFDVSYSAAWELGRLLTLQNKRASVDLFNWKRSHAQSIKDAERQLDHLPFDTSTALELPESVRTWFADLALLKGLPFNYLVPDECMLPTESIRFFQVDQSWVECLLDGAFSIGRVLPQDHDRDGGLRKTDLSEHLTCERKLSGFLLRSDVVSGWPGLLVDGCIFINDASRKIFNRINNTAIPDELQAIFKQSGLSLPEPLSVKKLNEHGWQILDQDKNLYYTVTYSDDRMEIRIRLLRMDRLSKNVLLCLFEGVIEAVDIHLKPETLHFGITEGDDDHRSDDGSPAKWYKTKRGENGDELKDWVDVSIKDNRVIEITDLAAKITTSGNSAEFALQMIEGVERVRFLQRAG
jgi:hypothetical protein